MTQPEFWWIFAPERHSWGGLRFALFMQASTGQTLVNIYGDTPARSGLRFWDGLSEREGWVKVKRIEGPTSAEIAAAIDAKMYEIAADIKASAGFTE